MTTRDSGAGYTYTTRTGLGMGPGNRVRYPGVMADPRNSKKGSTPELLIILQTCMYTWYIIQQCNIQHLLYLLIPEPLSRQHGIIIVIINVYRMEDMDIRSPRGKQWEDHVKIIKSIEIHFICLGKYSYNCEELLLFVTHTYTYITSPVNKKTLYIIL